MPHTLGGVLCLAATGKAANERQSWRGSVLAREPPGAGLLLPSAMAVPACGPQSRMEWISVAEHGGPLARGGGARGGEQRGGKSSRVDQLCLCFPRLREFSRRRWVGTPARQWERRAPLRIAEVGAGAGRGGASEMGRGQVVLDSGVGDGWGGYAGGEALRPRFPGCKRYGAFGACSALKIVNHILKNALGARLHPPPP